MSSETFAIRDARVFDGISVIERATVVVADGKITETGTDLNVNSIEHIIEGAGKTVMPGLIDAHAHAKPGALAQAIAFGVTTEIDLGSDPAWMDDQRELARTRDDVADVRSSSFGATTRGSHPSRLIGTFFPDGFPVIDDRSEVAAFIQARIDEGADFIKFLVEDNSALNRPACPSMPPEIATEVVREAHRHDKLALTHVTNLECARVALEAGTDALVHLFMDQPTTAEITSMIVENDVFVIPTLCTLGAMAGDRDAGWIVDDPRASDLIPSDWAENLRCCWPPNSDASLQYAMDAALALHHAGSRVLVGTDAASVHARGTAHGASMHDEMLLFVQAGFTPLETLTAATSLTADCFGLTDRGRVAQGLAADLILIDGDPTTEITDSLSIESVWRNGSSVDRGRATPDAAAPHHTS